jgi:NAD-dependent SIR2 family protein deacetylase
MEERGRWQAKEGFLSEAPSQGRDYGVEEMEEGVAALGALLRGRRVALLTGAGCSTDSGIPDYRGEESRKKKRTPIQYQQFTRDEAFRQRYWARSFLGWPIFREKEPNRAHHALAQWEASGQLTGIITQNVDRLHHKAGSSRILELHGALADVRCLACGAYEARDALQQRLAERNPHWHAEVLAITPDGDADLHEGAYAGFQIAPCLACGGMLKPDVVFFGENVAKPVVEIAWSILHEADALLVIGSSLTVFSGYRFVKRAAEDGKPIAILNRGETRGDPHATLRLNLPISSALPRLLSLL